MSDPSKSETLVDRWISRIKNNRVLAILVFLAIAFVGAASVADGWTKIAKALHPDRSDPLFIESSRVQDSYDTKVIFPSPGYGHSMPEPYFIFAFWDVTIVNNSDRAVSIFRYSIEPARPDLPSSKVPSEFYSRGLFDFVSSRPLEVPFTILSGHAIRLRVRSLVEISPYNISSDITKNWSNGLPGGKIPMGDLYYQYFASHGVDFFGNQVSAGPGGLLPSGAQKVKTQELLLRFTTGSGQSSATLLKWY